MNRSEHIVAENLSVSFEQTKVLQDVSFTITQGEFVGIFGPNGGGKTTLLRLLLGFSKPTNGKVSILGHNPKQVRTRVGYVPQINKLDKNFPITVIDVVLMGCLSLCNIFGQLPHSAREKALHALEKVGLKDQIHRPFGTLSGGQAQRALIARAIVNDPEILFLDEPTASVDPSAEEAILKLLLELKGKTTILMVTHDLQTIVQNVEKLLCVHRHVHCLHPNEVCEHFGLGLYHSPIVSFQSKGSAPS
jgi:zinc transport system ATP-binding protein